MIFSPEFVFFFLIFNFSNSTVLSWFRFPGWQRSSVLDLLHHPVLGPVLVQCLVYPLRPRCDQEGGRKLYRSLRERREKRLVVFVFFLKKIQKMFFRAPSNNLIRRTTKKAVFAMLKLCKEIYCIFIGLAWVFD